MADKWVTSSSKLESFEEVEILRKFEDEKSIGLLGGTIDVPGSSLSVPRNALTDEIKIKMQVDIVKRKQYHVGQKMLFGPQLDLGPEGTTFSKPVTISLPTCYFSADGERLEVEVQTRNTSKEWRKCQTGRVSEQGNVEFDLNHFSLYRFLMRVLGVKKSIAHISFIRQNDDNEYEMVWCFCDNIRETRLDVEKEMGLQEYKLVKATETFVIGPADDLRVSLAINACEIEDPIKEIKSDDIWFSDSVVQKEFIIRNLEDGKKIFYKIDITGGESKENSFTFKRNTGQMDPGPTVNVVDSRIGTLNV